MGARKHNTAEAKKEAQKSLYFAKLNNIPSSPRKMRLLADLIRGMEVNKALGVLKYSTKEPSGKLEKLLKSAIANWEQKTGESADGAQLYVKNVYVDAATMLKRLRTAPQGRGYRIRKRSNHVTIFVDTKATNELKTKQDGTEN
ncbi:MAG: 50S ribosomal protein L22 [Paludibacteraceae bacterium]|nr:50S ribosomal protein L22 [Paludibacteraceae bacterium]